MLRSNVYSRLALDNAGLKVYASCMAIPKRTPIDEGYTIARLDSSAHAIIKEVSTTEGVAIVALLSMAIAHFASDLRAGRITLPTK